MVLWIILGLLTGGVVLLLGKKTSFRSRERNKDKTAEVQVYVDQLKQIEVDLSQGTLSAGEASAARTEVARRLLNTAEDALPLAPQTTEREKVRPFSMVLVLLSIPILSLGLYAYLGSPELPSLPHTSRETPSSAETQIQGLIQKVEARLKEAPDDGTGWDVIAPIYLRLGNYAKANAAYKNASRLLGESPKRLAGLIQSDILLKDGKVSQEAKSLCERLLQLEPNRVDARIWLTLAKEQAGQFEEALKEYKDLLQTPNLTQELTTLLSERIAAIGNRKNGDIASPNGASVSSPTPSPPLEKAQSQQEMIESMVARLAQRLAADGRDAEGWTKLLRSYMVLGRREDAVQSLEKARRALANDPEALSLINTEATKLGVELPKGETEGQPKP